MTVLAVCSYAFIRDSIKYQRADSAIVLDSLTITQLQCIVLMFGVFLLPLSRKSIVF